MPKLLLVEDDKYLNKNLSDRLSLEGFQVTSALDGESAWSRLLESTDKDPFDLIILDMLLPRMMGAELLTKIRESGKFSTTKIHVVSGIYKDATDIREISELHQLDGYWTKPFHVDQLIAKLSDRPSQQKSSPYFRGRLKDVSFERLLIKAYDSIFTGTLSLNSQGNQRQIYFSNGFPVSAESQMIGESFGASLVLQRKITESQRKEASRRMVEEQCQFGQILTKMNLLTPDQIFDGLRKNTQRIILNCFTLKDGQFELAPLQELPRHIIHIEFNPLLLILKAQSVIYPKEKLLSLFEPRMETHAHRSQKLFQILPLCNLDAESLRFVRELPTKKNLKEILDLISADRREALLRILLALESIGVLEWKQSDAPPLQPVESLDFAEAFEIQQEASPELTQQLRAQYMEMMEQNLIELLHLSNDPSEGEITEAYRKRRFELHPDRFGQSLGGEAKRILDDMLSRIDHAYQVLSHPQSREAYQAHADKARQDSAIQSKKFLEAQNHFQRGMQLLDKSKFDLAKQEFDQAASIWSRTTEYSAYSVYCNFRKSWEAKDEASIASSTHALEKICQEAPSSEACLVLLAQVFRLQGKMEDSRQLYLQVLKINPENKIASDALHGLGGRPVKRQRLGLNLQGRTKVAALTVGLIVSAASFYWAQTTLIPNKEGDLMDTTKTQHIIPSLEIRLKKPEAKVVVQSGWTKDLPEPVLRSKCFQFVKEGSKLYGLERIQIYDSQRLVAFCSANSFRKFGKGSK